MTFKKTSFLFFTLLMVSTYMPFKKYELKFSNPDSSPDKSVRAEVVEVKKIAHQDNDCFDAQMEAWFLAFNQYQSMGFDMQQADNIAVADANIVYKNCNNTDHVQLASND